MNLDISIIELRWTHYNGFIFSIAEIETDNFQGALLGLQFGWKDYLIINFCYVTFEIKHPFL